MKYNLIRIFSKSFQAILEVPPIAVCMLMYFASKSTVSSSFESYSLCCVVWSMNELFCKTFVPKINEKFQSQKCLFVPLFNGNKSLQKDINDSAGDGKSNSLATACCFCCPNKQAVKPSASDIPFTHWHSFMAIWPNFYLINLPTTQWMWKHENQTLPIFLRFQITGVQKHKIFVDCIFTQSEFETRSGEMLGMIYPPLSLFTISQFISPFKPAQVF